jgi:ABC-type glycerol-3-phosphate transport system substrate-binding protein
MIYNKQLLDRAGVTAIPTTPEEFYQAVKQVKERTGEYGYGFPMLAAEELNAYITTMQWILGYGSDWADADGRVTANDPRNVEAMTWIKRFLDEDLAPKGVKIVDLRQMFAEGKLAFMFEGPWVMTLVKTKSPELYPYVNFVAPPTPTKAAITGGAFFAIPREAKNKELAWKYIAMINEEGWQRRWLEDLVQIPGQPIQPSPAFLEANPWVRNMIDIAANYQTGFGYAPPNPRLAVNAAEFRKIAMRYVERIYAGGDVKRELDAAQRDLEAFVAGLR